MAVIRPHAPLQKDSHAYYRMKTSRPTKRQRKEHPPSWLENESLSSVVSPFGKTIHTKVASASNKTVFLDRLDKEIIKPYQLVHSRTQKHEPQRKGYEIVKRRVIMGTNQCTRALEKAFGSSERNLSTIPSLIVLARDIYPPTILSHIPVMAEQVHVPILLLPGNASSELGKSIGTKKTSILLFLSEAEGDDDNNNNKDDVVRTNHAITSFVSFVKQSLL